MIYETEFKNVKYKFDESRYGHGYDNILSEQDIRNRFWNVKKDDIVFDVGAMSGSYTLPSLAIGAKVYAFEPKMIHFYDLSTNIYINKFRNCIPLNIGLFNTEGIIEFSDTMRSTVVKSSTELSSIDKIYVSTIDNIMQYYNIEKLDWLKIDTEGAELQVLDGGINTLKKFKPNILVENHTCFIPNIDIRTIDYLRKFGYDSGETINMQYGSHTFYKR